MSRCWRRTSRAGGGRFRGIRHSTAWDADPAIARPAHRPGARADGATSLPRGLRAAGAARPDLRRLALPSAARRADRPGRAPSPRPPIVLDHVGGAAGHRPLCRPAATRSSPPGRSRHRASSPSCPNVVRQAGRARHGHRRLRLRTSGRRRPAREAAGRRLEALHRDLHRGRSAPSAACSKATSRSTRAVCSYAVLWNAFKRIAAGRLGGREDRAVQRHGERVYRLTGICRTGGYSAQLAHERTGMIQPLGAAMTLLPDGREIKREADMARQ